MTLPRGSAPARAFDRQSVVPDEPADGTPKTEYTEANCAPAGCLWDNCQPCDAPDGANAWAWTVYGGNANTDDVSRLPRCVRILRWVRRP